MPKGDAAYTKYHRTEIIANKFHLGILIDKILINMDKQRVSLLMLLDLIAAFNTLDVNILQQIFQLNFMFSLHSSHWLQSHFENYKQEILI